MWWKVCSAVLLLGNAGCVWSGYRAPTETSFRTAGPPPCPRLGVQNLDDAEKTIALEALKTVCALVQSDEFRALMAAESLLERCTSTDRIAGPEVIALLQRLPDFSIMARKPRSNADAVTDPVNLRMAIRQSRFDDWKAGGARRAWMINTLVHEMTHLVLADGASRFQDEGHNRTGCPDHQLVSYRSGDVAEKVWLSRNGLSEGEELLRQ